MQQIRVYRKRRLAALVLRDRDLVLLGKGDERLARAPLPFPPWRNHRHVRLARVVAQLETYVVIALAGCAVRGGIRPGLFCDFDLGLGDGLVRRRGAEGMLARVGRVPPRHWK